MPGTRGRITTTGKSVPNKSATAFGKPSVSGPKAAPKGGVVNQKGTSATKHMPAGLTKPSSTGGRVPGGSTDGYGGKTRGAGVTRSESVAGRGTVAPSALGGKTRGVGASR